MDLGQRAQALSELLASGACCSFQELEPGFEEASSLSVAEVERLVTCCLDRLALERPSVPEADEPADPRHLGWWLLRMAGETCARAGDRLPPVDPTLISRFQRLVATRPRELEEHAQLHIDAESALRRALAVRDRLRARPGPVLAVGDDDGVTLALALLGVGDLHAVDIDERLLDYLEHAGAALGANIRVGCVDVFEDDVPRPWRGTFSAVITDPIRSFAPCMTFLRYASSCLRRRDAAGLFWADHPDWNLDHARVVAALPELGLGLDESLPRLHAYPLTPTWVSELPAKAAALGVDERWLSRLAEAAMGWSNLYVLSRR